MDYEKKLELDKLIDRVDADNSYERQRANESVRSRSAATCINSAISRHPF